jgi:hypothetical protein
MTPILGGDDLLHVLDDAQKDKKEKELRKKAREPGTNPKERNSLIKRANEISRQRSKRAHQGQD